MLKYFVVRGGKQKLEAREHCRLKGHFMMKDCNDHNIIETFLNEYTNVKGAYTPFISAYYLTAWKNPPVYKRV